MPTIIFFEAYVYFPRSKLQSVGMKELIEKVQIKFDLGLQYLLFLYMHRAFDACST